MRAKRGVFAPKQTDREQKRAEALAVTIGWGGSFAFAAIAKLHPPNGIGVKQSDTTNCISAIGLQPP